MIKILESILECYYFIGDFELVMELKIGEWYLCFDVLLVVLNVKCYDDLFKCFKGMFFYIFGSIGKFKGIK